MRPYDLPTEERTNTGFWKQNRWWIIPLLVFDVIFLIWWFNDSPQPEEELARTEMIIPQPPTPPGNILTFPTPHENALQTEPSILFMPTASGRTESAHYGSVRTAKVGKSYLASFHEGIDIAPVERDRKHHPVDKIFAAADGRVLYVNRVGGKSNYGKYVVLGHDDPLGEIYTLYAHMADVEDGLTVGKKIARGDTIGKMGHTASTGIPLVRAHLHFEIGVINNDHFYRWFKKQKMKPNHNKFHGYNMNGVNPLDAFKWNEKNRLFNMQAYLGELDSAFELIFKATARPDYFDRYPSLWKDEPYSDKAIVLSVSEGGVVLAGRQATEEEIRSLGRGKNRVINVNKDVLKRNGLRLIVHSKGEWILGRNGMRWLEILAYH